MSGALPETVTSIVDDVDAGLNALEARLVQDVERLSATLAELEVERQRIQTQLEEYELERSIFGRSEAELEADWNPEQLRQEEDNLTTAYSRISTLYRQLNGFVHLLTASRQQFRSQDELPGFDDAQRLTIRQAMIQAQEDERRRLAREIHDGPAQVVANAIIGLEFIGRALRAAQGEGQQPAAEEIERVKIAMREGLTEIRRFIFDLRPTMLSQRGLASTVEHYIQTYRHLFPGEVELSVPGELPRLSPDQEMTAFRVIQESLQNVHRHARSTRTWVTIQVKQPNLVVRVQDNGEGFRTSMVSPSSSGGFGLAGMLERAEVIGARLTVESNPGQGTTVELVVPLSSRALDAGQDQHDETSYLRRCL